MVHNRLKQLEVEKDVYPVFSFNHTPVTKKGFRESFLKVLEARKIEFLIFDSFRRFLIGSENDSETVARFFEFIDQIKEMGIHVLFLHHHKKTFEFGRTNLEEVMRGSSDLAAYPDAHIAVKKTLIDKKVGIRVDPVTLRTAVALSPFLVDVEHPDENFERIRFKFKLFVSSEEEKPQTCQLDILSYLEGGKNASREDLHNAFRGKYGQRLINATIERMHEFGLVNRTKVGRKFAYDTRSESVEPRSDDLAKKWGCLSPLGADVNCG